MLLSTIAFCQKHIMSLHCCFLKYFMKKSTYRLSKAFYLCICCSLCMECLLSLLPLPSFPSSAFPEPAQVELSIWALPWLPSLTCSELWLHFFFLIFFTSIITIIMLQCSLYNYLSIWTQLETSWTQGP